MSGERRSRAQIVLVGAIAIAFIVLGIVVVFNTVLYTENVDGGGSGSIVTEAAWIQDEVGDSVARMALSSNEGNQTVAELQSELSRNASNASILWQESRAQAGTAMVNFSFDNDSSQYGARVFQNDGGPFTAKDTSLNWQVSNESEPADVARFSATVNVTTLSPAQATAYHVAVLGTDGSGSYEWRVVRLHNDGGSLDVSVGNASGGTVGSGPPLGWDDEPATSTPCDDVAPTGSDIEVNFTAGTVEGSSCSFDFTDGIEPLDDRGYVIAFRNGIEAQGNYSLVLSHRDYLDSVDGTKVENASTGSPGAGPYYTPIVWRSAVTFQYDSTSLSYRETYTTEVYNSSR
ncbi:hypothetical protein [Haloarchaeobius sp. TZWWS8]|uniref:hypothetical protein n=1 Tax=Haloarchaeobius sp. TZWWS8 TaxID=3446121 RepID=UPI003EBF383B